MEKWKDTVNQLHKAMAAALLGALLMPAAAEATALPRTPAASGNRSAAGTTADTGNSPIRIRAIRPEAGQQRENAEVKNAPATAQSGMSAATDPAAAVTGYTEAEIREQMVKRYTKPRPAFRRVSGAIAENDYRPGTLDVKIPNLFFPADEVKEVSETFQENPDGTFGVRAPGDAAAKDAGYSAVARQQIAEQRQKAREERTKKAQAAGQSGKDPQIKQQPTGKTNPAARQKTGARSGAPSPKPKNKIITVQVKVPAPSPFRALAAGDFRWFTNNKGYYVVALLHSLPQDPLKGLPAEGPMAIRNAAQNEFMAVSVDDPKDTYHYKNKETFPTYGKAVPVFTETRKTIQNDDVQIKYIRYFMGGQYCLIVDGRCERAGKTYRAAVVFPESKQHEYLPKALYVMENLKGL